MRTNGVCFVLDNYYRAWGMTCHVDDIPSYTPLEKTVFPIPRGYQLQTVSWLGTLYTLPLLSARILSGLILCTFCVCCLSFVILCVDQSYVYGRYCFLGVIHCLWILQSFCHLFHIEGRGLIKTSF